MNAARRARSLTDLVMARSAEIQGQVVPVPATRRGTVQRVRVVENQVVRKGDVLMDIRASRTDRRLPASLEASWTAALQSPEVRAPVEGRVVQVDVGSDEPVERSQQVVAILESDSLWIVADFNPGDRETLRPGQRAYVMATGLEFTARIEWVDGDGSALLEFEEGGFDPAEVLVPGAQVEVTVDPDQPRLYLR